MQKLKIKIEREKDNSPDEKGYHSFEEVYEQVVDEERVCVEELISIINRPKQQYLVVEPTKDKSDVKDDIPF